MKHPFQILTATKDGSHVFASVKNNLLVFRTSDGALVGSWTDEVAAEPKKPAVAEPEKPPTKRAKTPKKKSIWADLPVYNYIRSVTLTRNEKHVIGSTDSDKAVVMLAIDHSAENCLSLTKRQVFPKRPCAVLTSLDDSTLIVADKFGDVYEIPIDESTPIAEKDLIPILGHVSMLSDVLVAKHGDRQFVLTGDRDEHIKVSHYPESYVVKHWLFGHHEFVSCMHICSFDDKLLVSGGGDDYLLVWDWFKGTLLHQIDLRPVVESSLTDAHFPPERFVQEDSRREITITKVTTLTRNGENLLLVLCENTNCILSFVVTDKIEFKQKIDVSNSIVHFTVVADGILASVDADSPEKQVVCLKFDDSGLLHEAPSEAASAIGRGNICEVESREDFYPLYYILTLRKRSEH